MAQFSTGALSNSGAANGTATYTITATNAAACNTVTFTVVVTIQPTLTASLANPATICSGAAVAAVTPTANIAGTTYTWTAPTMSAGITGEQPRRQGWHNSLQEH
ncbi:MAG: PKD-like domain-containing protein [Spirosomataceae bacterium]